MDGIDPTAERVSEMEDEDECCWLCDRESVRVAVEVEVVNWLFAVAVDIIEAGTGRPRGTGLGLTVLAGVM